MQKGCDKDLSMKKTFCLFDHTSSCHKRVVVPSLAKKSHTHKGKSKAVLLLWPRSLITDTIIFDIYSRIQWPHKTIDSTPTQIFIGGIPCPHYDAFRGHDLSQPLLVLVKSCGCHNCNDLL